MGTLGKIALIITPWLLVIGLMTYLVQGQFYAPDGKSFLIAFSSFSGVEAIRNIGSMVNGWGNKIQTAFGKVTDFVTFLGAIGVFLKSVGEFMATIVNILAIPFQILAWVFSNIFTGASIPEEEPSSSSGLLALFMC